MYFLRRYHSMKLKVEMSSLCLSDKAQNWAIQLSTAIRISVNIFISRMFNCTHVSYSDQFWRL